MLSLKAVGSIFAYFVILLFAQPARVSADTSGFGITKLTFQAHGAKVGVRLFYPTSSQNEVTQFGP